jgi:uncharacterized CHY-type Zn-finger protein
MDAPSSGTGEKSGSSSFDGRRIHGVRVFGLDVDVETRCRHYRGASDVVAIQMACCRRFAACIHCHNAVADHEVKPWPADSFDEKRVLCGACGERISIRSYIEESPRCPSCGHALNPGCERHHPLYFEV